MQSYMGSKNSTFFLAITQYGFEFFDSSVKQLSVAAFCAVGTDFPPNRKYRMRTPFWSSWLEIFFSWSAVFTPYISFWRIKQHSMMTVISVSELTSGTVCIPPGIFSYSWHLASLSSYQQQFPHTLHKAIDCNNIPAQSSPQKPSPMWGQIFFPNICRTDINYWSKLHELWTVMLTFQRTPWKSSGLQQQHREISGSFFFFFGIHNKGTVRLRGFYRTVRFYAVRGAGGWSRQAMQQQHGWSVPQQLWRHRQGCFPEAPLSAKRPKNSDSSANKFHSSTLEGRGPVDCWGIRASRNINVKKRKVQFLHGRKLWFHWHLAFSVRGIACQGCPGPVGGGVREQTHIWTTMSAMLWWHKIIGVASKALSDVILLDVAGGDGVSYLCLRWHHNACTKRTQLGGSREFGCQPEYLSMPRKEPNTKLFRAVVKWRWRGRHAIGDGCLGKMPRQTCQTPWKLRFIFIVHSVSHALASQTNGLKKKFNGRKTRENALQLKRSEITESYGSYSGSRLSTLIFFFFFFERLDKEWWNI